MKATTDPSSAAALLAPQAGRSRKLRRQRSVMLGGTILSLIVLVGVLAPYLGTTDPTRIDPSYRNKLPGTQRTMRGSAAQTGTHTYWMGTDSLGRDVYSRVVYGRGYRYWSVSPSLS